MKPPAPAECGHAFVVGVGLPASPQDRSSLTDLYLVKWSRSGEDRHRAATVLGFSDLYPVVFL